MTFSTPVFILLFFPVLLITFLAVKRNIIASNMLILLANVVYYIWAGYKALIFLFCYSIITYIFLLLLNKSKTQLRKTLFIIFFIVLFIPLFFVKYYKFIFPEWNILYPLGISFFTFQAISLVADYYNNKIEKFPDYFSVLAYLSFFITIVSGPITRYEEFKKGYDSPNFTAENFNYGIQKFVIGLSKKMLIANKISVITNYYFDSLNNGVYSSTLGLWVGAISYSLQLYFDFSGYSDMAIGIGKIFGFEIPENFNFPYIAKSISDFWKRWHISLTKWFKDYIYIPLGGNRCSKRRHIFNMLVVWLFTGIWHGSTLNFIIWGLLFFVLLLLEKYCKPFSAFIEKHSIIGRVYTLFFVLISWVIFNTPNVHTAVCYIAGLFGYNTHSIHMESFTLRVIPYLCFSAIFAFPVTKIFDKYQNSAVFKLLKTLILIVLFILSFAAVLNTNYSPFIYGNF